MSSFTTIFSSPVFNTSILAILISSSFQNDASHWKSWGNTELCYPKAVLSPVSLEEICSLIHKAHQEKTTIRFVGSGHAPLELTCTTGYVVKTDNFNKIIAIDTTTNYVTVEGGIKIKHLIAQLAEHNLALPNQGLITEQSIAGALATGTHGSGKLASFSDFVISIELIDGKGRVHRFTKQENPNQLQAACLNLGALGFVYRLTIACVPLSALEHTRVLTSWPEILNSYQTLFATYDHLMVMGHLYSDTVLLHTWQASKEKPTGSVSNQFKHSVLFSDTVSLLGFYAALYAPALTSYLLEWYLYFFQQSAHSNYSHASLSLGLPKEPTHYFEGEIAVPLACFADAVKTIKQIYNEHKKAGLLSVGLLFCRFVNKSNSSLLSPAYDHDTAYISFFEMGDPVHTQSLFEEIQRKLLPYGGRPHWGKYHTIERADLKKMYGQRLEDFNRIRRELDPHTIFANDHVKKIMSFYT